MAFFEVEFPKTISFGAVGGSTFYTNINEGFSGFEQRNRNWSRTRGKWNISLITPSEMDTQRTTFVSLLQSFFLVVGGRADGFRFKDFTDFEATAQPLATVTAGSVYQLQRTYTIGGRSYVRTITKPVTASVNDYKGNALTNTVTVYEDATPITPGDVSVDHTTGLVTIAGLSSPIGAITADFQHHFPVRFNMDDLEMQVLESQIVSGKPIVRVEFEIVEIRV